MANWWEKLKKWMKKIDFAANQKPCLTLQDDKVELTLPGLTISLTRRLNIDVPHEVHIIVPRAEMKFKGGESELIYSSITVVHASRHPLAGEHPPEGGRLCGKMYEEKLAALPVDESLHIPVKVNTSKEPPGITQDAKSAAIKITFPGNKTQSPNNQRAAAATLEHCETE